MTLYHKTLELLNNRPVTKTYEQIEKDTGIKVSWLKAFARETVKSPSVNTVQSLYEYLSGNKLEL